MSTDLQSDPRDGSLPVSSSARPGLHIENLSKRYKGGALANDGLRIDIEPGEIFGLLGPNGSRIVERYGVGGWSSGVGGQRPIGQWSRISFRKRSMCLALGSPSSPSCCAIVLCVRSEI